MAAFIDGSLPEAERRQAVAHLDACGDCYEVFTETVRFQGEDEPRGRVVSSWRLGSRRWHWPAVAAAAALVMAVLVAVPVLRMEPERPVVATLPEYGGSGVSAEALVAAIEVADGQALAGALRRGEPDGAYGFATARMDADTASFRAGTWLVGLRAAARAGDEAAARDGIRELTAALEAAGVAEELERPLDDAAEAAREGRLEEVDQAAGAIEVRAGELLEPLPLALGKWAEAGRLAAAVGAQEYFRSRPFTSFRHEISEGVQPEGVPEVVAEIRAMTEGGEVGPEELEELQEAFKELLATY